MPEPLAYLNGQLLPQSQARLSLNDAGFVFGATVTDLVRTYGKKLYRWTDHLARFRISCELTHIHPTLDDQEVTRLAHALIDQNSTLTPATTELCLVLFATPGPIGYYLGDPGGAGDAPPTIGMHAFPLPFARYRSLIQHGAELIVPNVRQVPATSIDPRIKQRSRLHWWLADREVRNRAPTAQALLVNEMGHITETAAANVIIVQGNRLATPPAGTVLPGVSLQVVRELCGRLGIEFVERPLTLEECLAADEALLTSTPYGIAGVRSLQGRTFAFPGPMFRLLREAWSAELGAALHDPFLSS